MAITETRTPTLDDFVERFLMELRVREHLEIVFGGFQAVEEFARMAMLQAFFARKVTESKRGENDPEYVHYLERLRDMLEPGVFGSFVRFHAFVDAKVSQLVSTGLLDSDSYRICVDERFARNILAHTDKHLRALVAAAADAYMSAIPAI